MNLIFNSYLADEIFKIICMLWKGRINREFIQKTTIQQMNNSYVLVNVQ